MHSLEEMGGMMTDLACDWGTQALLISQIHIKPLTLQELQKLVYFIGQMKTHSCWFTLSVPGFYITSWILLPKSAQFLSGRTRIAELNVENTNDLERDDFTLRSVVIFYTNIALFTP